MIYKKKPLPEEGACMNDPTLREEALLRGRSDKMSCHHGSSILAHQFVLSTREAIGFMISAMMLVSPFREDILPFIPTQVCGTSRAL
jgi:hypothetical protein